MVEILTWKQTRSFLSVENSKGSSKEGAERLCMCVACLGCWDSAGVQLGCASISSPHLLGLSPQLQLFGK